MAKISPVDARAAELIREASSVPSQPAEAAAPQVDSVVPNPATGFEKYKATAGQGAAGLFADHAPQFDRVKVILLAMHDEPMDVQAAVLDQLVKQVFAAQA